MNATSPLEKTLLDQIISNTMQLLKASGSINEDLLKQLEHLAKEGLLNNPEEIIKLLRQ